ncbi:ISL3 family transposase [Enterococcus timonensis]|uniref:ISL3 family transposase n=1 Tax=Enterococcus timonensis TaxID=1852364 RepID=UPI0008DACBA3|nr:ISL3 family transposase [Enterococcus timonensis]
MTNDIKDLLRITEKDLTILSSHQEMINHANTMVIEARLTNSPDRCLNCGCPAIGEGKKRNIVKNGLKKSVIRFEPYQFLPTVMRLAKQRFACRSCKSFWTIQTQLVDEFCFIATHVKLKILSLLKEKISATLIAKLCSVSVNTVLRLLRSLEDYIPGDEGIALPKVLMVDEFKSHLSVEDKMTFICADGESGKLVDILPSKKLDYLVDHFKKSPDCEKVKFIVTDMNAAYFQLIPKVFKNAELIIDRFHIIKRLNDAFNEFRVREVKRLMTNGNRSAARKIKSNWRRFLKNSQNIDISTYKSWRSFPTPKFPLLTEQMMIDRLLSYSPALRLAYDCFHILTDAMRRKDDIEFFDILQNLPLELDEDFSHILVHLLTYETGIRNAMKYPYSNGKIEAKNTHIKTLKRNLYGFKSYTNTKTRIFLLNGLIEIN